MRAVPGPRLPWLRNGPVDGLALYRVALGTIVALDAALVVPHAGELYSSTGFHVGPWATWAPAPDLARALCIALASAGALAALGIFTRAALVAAALLQTFLWGIDEINDKTSTTLCIVAAGILAFSGCGKRWSLTAWLRSRGRHALPVTPFASTLPQRILQLVFLQCYFFAGLVKLTHEDWRNGAAVGNALHGRWATGAGIWLSGLLGDPGERLLAGITMGFELLAPILLLVPHLRAAGILFGVLFHVGIQATLNVGALGPHFLVALLCLFPAPETVARVLQKLRPGNSGR